MEGFLLKALEPNTTSVGRHVFNKDGKVLGENCLRRLSTAQNVLTSLQFLRPSQPTQVERSLYGVEG